MAGFLLVALVLANRLAVRLAVLEHFVSIQR
jgi:hypothetical protein